MSRCCCRAAILCLLLNPILLGDVLYVDKTSGGGDGSSWEEAFTELQAALDMAQPGDDIWIAAGVFTPDYDANLGEHNGNRSASFQLKDNVGLFGGFSGNEVERGERKSGVFITVLSGDLLGNDGPDFSGKEENSYHVVVASGTDATAVLDGVIIAGGHANGGGTDDIGAGIYNIGGSPTITDCTVSGNVAAFQGGGMQNKEGANPVMTACVFSGNHAGDNGGAMYNGASSPQLVGCSMVDNTADVYAGGVCNRDLSNALFDGCTFERNTAGVLFPQGGGGGAMVNAHSHPTIVDCIFIENANVSGNGGAMVNEAGFEVELGGSNPQITNTQFIGNTGFFWGGAIYSKEGSHPTITGCMFDSNLTIYCGGALYTTGSELTVQDTTFQDNATATVLFTNGGAVYSIASTVTATNCTFERNITALGGGALYSDGCDVVLDNSSIVDNHAMNGNGAGGGVYSTSSDVVARGLTVVGNSGFYGGGMYNAMGTADVSHSLFAFNTSDIAGAGMSNTTSTVSLRHCAVVGNTASISAGGVYNFSGTDMDMTGCLLWGNMTDGDPVESSQVTTVGTSTIQVTYSNIEGLDTLVGPGNISADPLFVDGVGGDMHLTAGSPCVNAGHPGLDAADERDIDGEPRLAGVVDIGADEVHDCNDNGITDHMEFQADPNIDCNGNIVIDSCDIAAGTSLDDNGDGVPDECGSACSTIADCADLDGNGVRDDGCTWWACDAGTCAGTGIAYADMGGFAGACEPDGTSDINDRFGVLNCFANVDTQGNMPFACEAGAPVAYNVDAASLGAPCAPDGICDLNDAFAAISAFDGSTTCSCAGGAPNPSLPVSVEFRAATLELVADRERVSSGQLVDVDVYVVGGVEDVRGYQLHAAASPGLELMDVSIATRRDHVFATEDYWAAFNLATGQMLAGIDHAGVASVREKTYLATLVYRVRSISNGNLFVDLRHDRSDPAHRTVLLPTVAGGRIDIETVRPAVLRVKSR